MFINRWMNKEDVVRICNGISLSHKRNNIGSLVEMWMDQSICYTEWSSQKEKKILSINIGMWNLEKWYKWTCLQGRNKDTDVETVWTWAGEGIGMNWEIGIDMCTLSCIKQMASGILLSGTGSLAWCSGMTFMGGLEGVVGTEVQGRGDMCLHTADSHHCTTLKLAQHCKAAIPQLKDKPKGKKKICSSKKKYSLKTQWRNITIKPPCGSPGLMNIFPRGAIPCKVYTFWKTRSTGRKKCLVQKSISQAVPYVGKSSTKCCSIWQNKTRHYSFINPQRTLL